ncbi:uncharacterized protein LOC123296563 [Chrysoperla carnea]|uniref:uncharacterized protein LOC123296563 n=1 Tax=Chrysoperla carnea TaxID=189513 RepID=UPI001D08F353|nr:uncharacterized protein LOC123296563 [Chrysoperla carnea]
MESSIIPDIEELTICGFCKQKFNDNELVPKMLSCKHYFCLQCTRTALNKAPGELYCVHCWKCTELDDLGPESLPTFNAVLQLAKNFSTLKLGTKPPEKSNKVISENCHTHAMPLALWCHTCCTAVCRACATTSDHANHQIKSQSEAKDQLVTEVQIELVSMTKMLTEIQRLGMQQRDFLLKILEACVTLKTHIETDLTNGLSHFELSESRELLAKTRTRLSVVDNPAEVHSLYSSLSIEKQQLQMRYQEMFLQCQLDDLIRNSNLVFDFQLLKQALANIHSGEMPPLPTNSRILPPHTQHNPILFLANYCMSQLYTRHVLSKQHLQNGNVDYHHTSPVIPPHLVTPQHAAPHLVLASPKNIYTPDNNSAATLMPVPNIITNSPQPNIIRNPTNIYPLYYFNIDVNGTPQGRLVIEVRPDVAPKMSKNFGMLATGEIGVGYKGCSIFQCWEGESVITGDFELNNGRGGRSIFEDGYFMPDDTKLLAVRGAVGMRRTQKRHDNMGMVGSQFRIILQEMRGFTAIFGHVVEGLELVEKISTFGDPAGKPTKTVIITKCGKL